MSQKFEQRMFESLWHDVLKQIKATLPGSVNERAIVDEVLRGLPPVVRVLYQRRLVERAQTYLL